MKVKNLKVGMTVKVKKKAISCQHLNGLSVKIVRIDPTASFGLHASVESIDGKTEWFNAADLKRIK